MRICLVRLSALGDVAMATSVVMALQASYPQAEITWVIGKQAYDLVKDFPRVRFIVLDKPKGLAWLRVCYQFWMQIRDEHFDVLLCMQSAFRVNLLYPLIRAKRKIGFDTAQSQQGHRFFVTEQIPAGHRHVVDDYLQFAKMVGADISKPAFFLPRRPVSVVIPTDKPIVAIHLCASKPERDWSLASILELIGLIQQRYDVHIAITGGSSEREKQRAVSICSQYSVLNYVDGVPISQTPSLHAHFACLIAPDSGPAHMANCFGVPVIGLFAVSRPNIYCAYYSPHFAVNMWNKAVELFLNKKVDTIQWKTRVRGDGVMELIKPAQVMQMLEKVYETF